MAKRLVVLVVVGMLVWASQAVAADSPVGTWLKKPDPERSLPPITMVIERWGTGGAKISYLVGDGKMTITIVTGLDGKDAPVVVDGKVTDETMAITRVDKRHTSTVLKKDGSQTGTSKGTFSADFNTFTVETNFSAASAPGKQPLGKVSETWTRK